MKYHDQTQRDRLARDIFLHALEIDSLEARAAYLERASQHDELLRARVEVLLRSDRQDSFMEIPAVETIAMCFPEPAFSEPVGKLIGRYKIVEKIGEGGCGVVYLAEQQEPVRRCVALKVIKLGMDTRSVIARFEAERQALALMDHPNIAKVLDASATEAGRPYFVMELVRGIKITEYCDQNTLSTRDRLDLFINVCHAIQHAHQKGIIHRDIKPSNILLTANDGLPVPKVIDFGIAKAIEGRLTDKTVFTAFEQFIGTPAYMSPEQALMTSADIDTRSDIYSLGVLLYELLTGQPPFNTQELLTAGLDEMRRIIREQEPPRPSVRLASKLASPHSGLDLDLDWIVMKCLEKDRSRRYETANGLAADLKRYLAHEPVVARPPSHLYRFQKLVRRNKLAVAAVTAVSVTLVAGLAASTWQTIAARKAQRETEVARNGELQQRLEAQAAQKAADILARKASVSEQHSRRLLYASDMNLAQQALKLNNVGRARRLLDRNRPHAGEDDLRGWEWRYLWQLTRSGALATVTNRPTRGSAVSFSKDGTQLAVGWEGGRIELWDVAARRFIRALTDQEHHHVLGQVVFSPVGNLLAATPSPEKVVLYDLDSGRESVLWHVPAEELWSVRDLSFSMDGSKVVIYAGSVEKFGDAVWVVDVATLKTEGRYQVDWSNSGLHGAARLSPDNARLYVARSDHANYRFSIQCIDLTTASQLWQTKYGTDYGLTALAVSPDGLTLASGSGFEDPAVRIWEAATGKLLDRLDGHTGWVSKLAFTHNGAELISSASDQTIRFWNATDWTKTPRVLRGHTDEVYAVAISEAAQLAASAGKDGNIILWQENGRSASDGYRRLDETLRVDGVRTIDGSRVLLLPPARQPEWVDLKGDSAPVPLSEIGFSTNVARFFGTNILCRWDGTNQMIVHKWIGKGFVRQGAISLDSDRPPVEFIYNPARQLLAWTKSTAAKSVNLASLKEPSRRTELLGDRPWLVLFQFSEDGKYLAATASRDHSLRAWNCESGLPAATINERVRGFAFAAGGRVLVTATERGSDHDISFFDLEHPGQVPRRFPGKGYATSLALSPGGGMVVSAAGQVRIFDAIKGEQIESVQSHLNGSSSAAFSPDGRRLISSSGGREAVKLWDVGTWQELLTLAGKGSLLEASSWSADGDVILTGPPWQAWSAPSWRQVAEAEAKEKTTHEF